MPDVPSTLDRVTGRKKQRKSKKSALVRAQERLQWLCYFGVGDIYLGETQQEYELLDDGTEKLVQDFRPQRWKWARRKCHPHDRYKEIRSHRLNCRSARNNGLRGVCRDVEETHIPFLKMDGDRHGPEISVSAHLKTAAALHSEARRHPLCSWLVEINMKNGSVSYFGFIGRKPIVAEKAKQQANALKDCLEQRGIHVEVFPSTNCPQVRLPWRPDKLYLLGDKVYQPGDDQLLIDFWNWDGSLAPWSKVQFEIVRACAALPYVAPKNETRDDVAAGSPPQQASNPKIGRLHRKPADARKAVVAKKAEFKIKDSETLDELRREPNAHRRQLHFGLYLSHVLRRVPTVDELEQAIFDQKMYSEPWDNPVRRSRLESIVNFIAQDFDPAKLRPLKQQRSKPQFQPSRFGKRCAVECPWELPVFSVRNFSPETMKLEPQMVKVTRKFIRKVADMTYHFLVVQPEENDGVSTRRFKANWNSYLPSVAWNEMAYRACRDWMNRAQWCDIYDRHHSPQKCWRWRLGRRAKELATSAMAAFIQVLCGKTDNTHNKHNYLCLAANPKIVLGQGEASPQAQFWDSS